MWKIVQHWKTDENFVKWAKAFSNKLKGEVGQQFEESWPIVRNNDPSVRASYVLYWQMRATEGVIHQMNQPMSIAYLAYLADGAQATGRSDLMPILNNMILNIPRIHAEIAGEILKGDSSEEE